MGLFTSGVVYKSLNSYLFSTLKFSFKKGLLIPGILEMTTFIKQNLFNILVLAHRDQGHDWQN